MFLSQTMKGYYKSELKWNILRLNSNNSKANANKNANNATNNNTRVSKQSTSDFRLKAVDNDRATILAQVTRPQLTRIQLTHWTPLYTMQFEDTSTVIKTLRPRQLEMRYIGNRHWAIPRSQVPSNQGWEYKSFQSDWREIWDSVIFKNQ